MRFPLDKETWYIKRDDRTNRVGSANGFENFKTGIILDNELANDLQCQVMVLIICNVLARWCRNITIQISEHSISQLNFSKGEKFKELIERTIQEIDPYVDLKFNEIDENKVDKICVVRNQNNNPYSKAIWIDCDGWQAGMGVEFRKENYKYLSDRNILGAAFAACLGSSELFKQAIGCEALKEEQWYSLWDFKKSIKKDELINMSYIENWCFGHIQQPG